MTRLDYVEVSTGVVLDTVTLADGELHFASAAAVGVFAARRAAFGWSAARAFAELAGWSNGYMALRPRP